MEDKEQQDNQTEQGEEKPVETLPKDDANISFTSSNSQSSKDKSQRKKKAFSPHKDDQSHTNSQPNSLEANDPKKPRQR
jgi:hypothetical protein